METKLKCTLMPTVYYYYYYFHKICVSQRSCLWLCEDKCRPMAGLHCKLIQMQNYEKVFVILGDTGLKSKEGWKDGGKHGCRKRR